eukprot:11423947-Prorocentrum_lima.AAC.1
MLVSDGMKQDANLLQEASHRRHDLVHMASMQLFSPAPRSTRGLRTPAIIAHHGLHEARFMFAAESWIAVHNSSQLFLGIDANVTMFGGAPGNLIGEAVPEALGSQKNTDRQTRSLRWMSLQDLILIHTFVQ